MQTCCSLPTEIHEGVAYSRRSQLLVKRLLDSQSGRCRTCVHARSAVAKMTAASVIPVLLTGDNERAARRVTEELGIEEYHAGVLPGDKAQYIREFQKRSRVAMVGDRINEAPALVPPDVGVASAPATSPRPFTIAARSRPTSHPASASRR